MITSITNRRVKWVRSLQTKRRARHDEKAFVIEGLRLAREAAAAQLPVRLVLHTNCLDERGRLLLNDLAFLGAKIIFVSDAVMAACSNTESPPGLLAVVPFPTLPPPERLTLALVADRLTNPGNLGTMLRTSLAAGVEKVFLTEGTVDPYNPKVVRGAMGAHFHLPMESLNSTSLPERLAGLTVWLAEAGEGQPYHEVDWHQPVALVIGGEAKGARSSLRSLASGRVCVPMAGKSESLNAAIAAAVILFEILRQRGPT
jgi:TrmH family RNA methyltransferase